MRSLKPSVAGQIAELKAEIADLRRLADAIVCVPYGLELNIWNAIPT
jgi:hypothetical protein